MGVYVWGWVVGIRGGAWKKSCNMHGLCSIFMDDTAEYSPTFDDDYPRKHKFQMNNLFEDQGMEFLGY